MKEVNFKYDKDKELYIEKCIKLFVEKEKNGFETRYKSWETCHNFFIKLYKKYNGKKFDDLNETDKQLSLLNISFYLASWGMYRGSSFVLQYDNSIYKQVIDIILDKKYSILWDLNYSTIREQKALVENLLIGLRDKINKALIDYRIFFNTKSKIFGKDKDEAFISQTLTTKILLGTICCCPAYDTYFSNSISGKFSNFNDNKKIDRLLDLVVENEFFAKLSTKYNYPLMKIVDMAFFNMGIENDFKTYYQKYIVSLVKPESEYTCKQVIKSIRLFYYKLNNKEDYNIHVAFDCDKSQVDKFIAKYKIKVNE